MLPKRLKRKTIYKSPWINLFTDKVLMPSGKIIEKYHFLDYPKESIVVLLTNSKHEICFIKSLRYTTKKIECELPAGGIEKDESILNAAKREVLEETGFRTKSLEKVYSFNPSNGMSNQLVHVIFGTISNDKQKYFDTDEVKEVHWFSLKKIKNLILNNKITDGVALVALSIYYFKIFKLTCWHKRD
ncbi:NUDIX hydrolase [bacterium]|nr:NUDIX hydrolase [bacterium]|tara:strand:+ start:365 stop:925 length:561 start_codon:yes stop_codon:yes gene_type:complete